jgi:hypothetical protein
MMHHIFVVLDQDCGRVHSASVPSSPCVGSISKAVHLTESFRAAAIPSLDTTSFVNLLSRPATRNPVHLKLLVSLNPPLPLLPATCNLQFGSCLGVMRGCPGTSSRSIGLPKIVAFGAPNILPLRLVILQIDARGSWQWFINSDVRATSHFLSRLARSKITVLP